MRFASLRNAGVAALLPLSAAASSQFISSLPHCWQNCISTNSPDCRNSDLSCICSIAGSGNFLTHASSCINDQCADDNLDPSQIIAPFQAACNSNGSPIPSSVIGSRSLPSSHNPDSTGGTTTTTGIAAFTDSVGHTHTVAIPIVIGASTTEYGNPMTASPSATSVASSVTSNISIMGLPKSTIPSVSSATSYNTVAPLSTYSPISSITYATTTTSSGSSSSKSSSTHPASSSTADTGSLLDLQGAGTRKEARSLLGLVLGVVAGVAWF